MKLRQFYVYILSNKNDTVTYIGVTNNLIRRVWEHKTKSADGFTKRYNIDKLVFYETCDSAEQAIAREKQIKNWHRDWKFNLIRSMNKDMHDLHESLTGDHTSQDAEDAETSSA